MPLSPADDVAKFATLRSARAPKVEWVDSFGRACPRAAAHRVRLTKYAGRGLKAVKVEVTPAQAEAMLKGPLI